MARESSPHTVIRKATARFRHLDGADVAWLGVRESRSRSVAIQWGTGGRSLRGLGLRIEPGSGAGGSVLLNERPWCAHVSSNGGDALTESERGLLTSEDVARVLIVPLKGAPLGPGYHPRIEGLAYIGRRDDEPFCDEMIAEAVRLGERVALSVRNAQRLDEALRRWASTELAHEARDQAPEQRLDGIAVLIATDARVLLRSGLGIVFRLDRRSGALHALGVDGGDLAEVRRGQVLPPGCGSAGRAVETLAPFIAADYGSGTVRVPPILADAMPRMIPFTTLSVPLIVMHEVIGALTVGRPTEMPYTADDVRLIEQLAAEAAPFLARAQHAADTARRQQGACELSRFAGSLTEMLTVSAVCERLVRSVASLVRPTDAAVWDLDGRVTCRDATSVRLFCDPSDASLQPVFRQVIDTRRAFWTPDLGNDPRLATDSEASVPFEDAPHHAVLAVPVRINGTLLAILGVADTAGRMFSDADVELVQGLADLAALAMTTARGYHDLQLSRAAMLRHEKLVVAGRLAAGLAHELRNPLQNAVGFVAEMRDVVAATEVPAPGFEEFPLLLKHVQNELHRAAGIVGRLLDYVRDRKPLIESVDIRDVVADAVALVSGPASTSGKQITLSAAEVPLRVRGDAVMLKQVVLNLLNNALDALDGGGDVSISARLEPDASGPGRVIVTVRDTGRGISPEILPNVFDAFYTTKDVGQGVGLGLAICQSLIEQHGGTITISSAGIGKGTTVAFELRTEP